MWRALLILVVMLALPAAAEARPFSTDEMRMVELAHDHWGRGPSQCHPITYVAEPLRTTEDTAGWWAMCQLHVEPNVPWVEECTNIAHEWGHALQESDGLPMNHSPVLGDLMSESPDTTNECARADDRRVFRKLKRRCGHIRPKAKRQRCVRRARRSAFT